MWRLWLLVLALVGSLLVAGSWAADTQPSRQSLREAFQKGNYKDAYDGLSKLVIGGQQSGAPLAQDFQTCISALGNLGRISEADAFIEKAIAANARDPHLLRAAAQTYGQGLEHYGAIVAGKFERGGHRGGTAKYVNSFLRDRVRSLQLMAQVIANMGKQDQSFQAELYHQFADMLINGYSGREAWRLGTLTDLTTLPDYEEGYGYHWHYHHGGRGAPVNEDGSPVFHSLPKTWDAATTDGQRWRWCMMQAAEVGDENMKGRVKYEWASFLREQFGVHTMAYGAYGRTADTKENDSGPLAVSTLREDETIARLASGIKRFKLPAEFNFLKIGRDTLAGAKHAYSESVAGLLEQELEDRQQYPKAAEVCKQIMAKYGRTDGWAGRLAQIEGNWGRFDGTRTEAAGKPNELSFRFRNGKKVTFTAHEIAIEKLVEDVKAYIRTKPNQYDWEKLDISQIGYRLVERNQQQYLGKEVAQWELALEPRPAHFDRRISVKSPLNKPGAYLIRSTMDGGNTTFIVQWIADTGIVRKPLDKGVFFYVADANTGKGLAKATLDFFGYTHRWIKENKYTTDIVEASGTTDENGQYVAEAGKVPQQINNYGLTYIITGRTADGRFSYLGPSNLWYAHYERSYDYQYNQPKPYFMTDRPVYRPGHTMKWKLWLNTAKYDVDGKSQFAGQTLPVWITSPKGDKIKTYSLQADDFGGVAGEFAIEKEATLGVYYLLHPNYGGIQFRVEEYKKPEFEVKVDAPTEPVMLGDKIRATINAKYYFGSPVVNAKVKYKVTRDTHDAQWYPTAYWDWYYEPGYWWWAYDYVWYPGWHEWGCKRPYWPWRWHRWGGRGQPQPEVVAENEVPVGADGTVKVDIDTSVAKALQGDVDHRYTITAEVTDQSRRTITGTGTVLVARKPFKVYAWIDRGYARIGDVIRADFCAQTLDNKPVVGKGLLKLFKISYAKDGKPSEKSLAEWPLETNAEGKAHQQFKAGESGQLRLSYTVTDSKGRSIEGGYVFFIRANDTVAKDASFRFNDIELVPEKREYKAGETVRLAINTNREDATVLLFVRPANGVYLPPKFVQLKGKSTVEEVAVTRKDMPNFFVEACVVYNANVFSDVREIVVPPEDRVLNVAVEPSASEYKPGAKAKIKIKVTEKNGEPFNGSTVVAVYDKAVEYISGGSNVTDIRSFFWKWRRHHYPTMETSLSKGDSPHVRPDEKHMAMLGAFGHLATEVLLQEDNKLRESGEQRQQGQGKKNGSGGFFGSPGRTRGEAPAAGPGLAMEAAAKPADGYAAADRAGKGGEATPPAAVEPTVRKNFADTALWVSAINTDKSGTAEVELTMPESLTTWKTRVWTLGAGTRVGQGEAEMVTRKNLIVRLQAPRFFVTTDEVVLSANVHNYLKTKKNVRVVLELDGSSLVPLGGNVPPGLNTTQHGFPQGLPIEQRVDVDAGGEKRVDFRVRVVNEGTATVRMKAITNEESDAMQMSFPVYIHGMLKTESFSGAIRRNEAAGLIRFTVPKERRAAQSRVEIRYSPSLATALVDALPYMVEYPYGCTEQTLNRFVPTVITQKILLDMKIDLAAVKEKRTNLNAQEIGDPQQRAAQWKRFHRNPVFDKDEVGRMVKQGVQALTNMQLSDGGWGWFSGWGEHSWPHTTAVVVHGLQVARANDVAVDDNVLNRGITWLVNYQSEQVGKLKHHDAHGPEGRCDGRCKLHADAIDALVFMVTTDAAQKNADMQAYLYRDRTHLPVYAKALYGLALHKLQDKEKLDMILQNIKQFLVEDNENQTAYLKLPDGYWWYWYGSDIEANAFYLKLLSKTDPKGNVAAGLAKYILNNRKHATYWNSTRDSAYAIEALADFARASGETVPDMTLEVALDGKKVREVKIDASNLFTFDSTVLLEGAAVTTGQHEVSITRKGSGPVYFNAYVTNFTLEDRITRAGLEIKIDRKFYQLTPVDRKVDVEGARGQALKQKVEKFARTEIADLSTLKSGQLCEVELVVESKNDYEYIILEDMKAAGFEPVEVRSGYNGNDMHAYVEFRDERVCFFVRQLARGKHSVSYRLRAEIPGKFSALPSKAAAMYAPELRANSDEFKVRVED